MTPFSPELIRGILMQNNFDADRHHRQRSRCLKQVRSTREWSRQLVFVTEPGGPIVAIAAWQLP